MSQSFPFDPRYIGDYNSEGYDSVESQDHDPGFGAVAVKAKREHTLPEQTSSVLLAGNAKGYKPLSAANDFLKYREDYIKENGLEKWEELNSKASVHSL